MVKSQERLSTPDKVEMFKNYDDVMNRILAEAKREKENLDHQILLKKTEYRNVSDMIVKQQTQFEQWKRAETQKLDQELNKKRTDFINRENVLRVGEQTFNRKMEEISERERISVGFVEQRQKLNNDRIEVEKLHSKAKDEMLNAQLKFDEVNNKIANLTDRERKLAEKEKTVNSVNANLAKREEEIYKKEKDIDSRISNLEEVKKVVEPKIQELKIIEESIKKEKAIVESEKQVVLSKIEEESSLLKGIEAREKKVKDKEKELSQKDEEITRKALLAGVK